MNGLDVARWRIMIATALADVTERADEFSALDAAAGDGDHGTAIVAALTAIAGESHKDTAFQQMLSDMAMAAMGRACGSTSTLIGSLFLGMSDGVETSELDARATAAMFAAGLSSVQQQTKAAVGDRTMMDALIPAVEAMQANCADGLQPMFEVAATAAAEGADRTKNLVARFGRARNLGDRVLGHVDAGAASMACIFNAFARSFVEQGSH